MHGACGLYGQREARGNGKKLIKSDAELELLHYYVQKGFDWDKIITASVREKMFLQASMVLAIENEAEKYNALFGDGRGKSKRASR